MGGDFLGNIGNCLNLLGNQMKGPESPQTLKGQQSEEDSHFYSLNGLWNNFDHLILALYNLYLMLGTLSVVVFISDTHAQNQNMEETELIQEKFMNRFNEISRKDGSNRKIGNSVSIVVKKKIQLINIVFQNQNLFS